MKSRALSIAMMVGLMLAALPAAAALGDDDNGQAIGQNPVRLALTQCSNAGAGNDSEYQLVGLGGTFFHPKAVLAGECLKKKFDLTQKEDVLKFLYAADAIAHQTTEDACEFAIFEWYKSKWYIGASCEIDPGNSASHNQAGD